MDSGNYNSFETHASMYHEESCDGVEHWVYCSKPEPYERTQTLITCPPGCKRGPGSSGAPSPKRAKPNNTPADQSAIILQHKYDLNASCTKTFDVGVRINSNGEAETVLSVCDNSKGRKISFDISVWHKLQTDSDITIKYLETGELPVPGNTMVLPLNRQGTYTVECRQLYEQWAVILVGEGKRIAMMLTTFRCMLRLDTVVQVLISDSYMQVNTAISRMNDFANILGAAMEDTHYTQEEARYYLTACEEYNALSLIDVELANVAINVIMRAVERKME